MGPLMGVLIDALMRNLLFQEGIYDIQPNNSIISIENRMGLARGNRMKKRKIPEKYQVWIDVRNKYKLSHAHVQMAKELGMNPKKLGSLTNHKQEPWKAPLPIFIEDCYLKRFKKEFPDDVVSVEDRVKSLWKKREEKKQKKQRDIETSISI